MRDGQSAPEKPQQPNSDGISDLRGRRVLSWSQWGEAGAGVYDRGVGEGTWRSDQHRLVVALTPMPPLLLQIDGGPPTQLRPGVGALSFYSAESAYRTAGTGSRYAHVCWSAQLYGVIAPDLSRPPQLEPMLTFPDPLLDQLLRSLVGEIDGSRVDRLLADSLVTAIAMRIAQRFRPSFERQPDLPPPRMRRVLEYIEANLDAELTLAELAAVACLSPCHFSRSFTGAVGLGPQRYTVQRRVERAKALLRRGGGSLADVAATTGFADQSHLTAAFRRETGTTPGRFRAASS